MKLLISTAVLLSLILTLLSLTSLSASAHSQTYITVEEVRLDKVNKEMPNLFDKENEFLKQQIQILNDVTSQIELQRAVIQSGQTLWTHFRDQLQQEKHFDDRGLYWNRLSFLKQLRTHAVFRAMMPKQRDELIWQFELASRGNDDIVYEHNGNKIFVTGFDPFLLDRNIKQSNPSGIAALWLDGKVIEYKGQKAQIEAVVIPVRFADFDQGMIEHILMPIYQAENVKMITTISMGRSDFDLERFPSLRRSSAVPDNLNVFTGASLANPLKPFDNGREMKGPEFVEFSLPVNVMQQAKGKYKINDNNQVTTIGKDQHLAPSLQSLADDISVVGSGGGYLSNEISYRSILLRDKFKTNTLVGHIHTPRYVDWELNNVKDIINQIEQMLRLATNELNKGVGTIR